MFFWALRVSCPEFLYNELQTIRSIAKQLRYPDYFIDSALNKAKKSFYGLNQETVFNMNNLLVLPFHEKYSSIPKLLKPLGINVVFKNNKTIKKILIKNSPEAQQGCIYEIPCSSCNSKYVGQTSKELPARVKQHQYCVRMGNMSNSLFTHMNEHDHAINWRGSKEILFCREITRRNILESCIIKKEGSSLLNTSPGMYKLDEILINNIFNQIFHKI